MLAHSYTMHYGSVPVKVFTGVYVCVCVCMYRYVCFLPHFLFVVRFVISPQAFKAEATHKDPISRKSASYSSAQDVCKFITELGISKVCVCVFVLANSH